MLPVPETAVALRGPSVAAATVASVIVGLAVSLQSRVNAALAVRLVEGGEAKAEAGFHSALISFSTGLLLLALGVALLPRMRRALSAVAGAVRGGRLQRWQLLGGVGGAWLVTTQGLTVPVLGVALFLVSVVAGQLVGSIGADAAALGPAGRMAPTRQRVFGAAIAFAAVAVAVAPRLEAADRGAAAALLLGALALSAGLGVSVQQALNAHVAVAGGWAPVAAAVNFATGTAALLTVVVCGWAIGGWPLAGLPAEPWLYIGGPIGVAFIAIAAWVVPVVGVLRFALAAICGQLAGGAAVDVLLPQAGVAVGWQVWAGAGLTVVAVLVANRR